MGYNLSLDCGGTKVMAILYDETFRPLRQVRVGSVRPNTTSQELIRINLQKLEAGLFGAERPPLCRLSGILPTPLVKALKEAHSIEEIVLLNELDLGLYAARLFGNGILTICGTGATVMARVGDTFHIAGGYGASISDEGSGYWRGRLAFEAAIHHYEGRGDPTSLTDKILQKIGGTNFRDAVSTVYTIPGISPAAFVASCSQLVDEAAAEGDAVALEIIRRAGVSLGNMVNALTRKQSIPPEIPLTISGSVWKGHPLMLREFRRTLQKETPMRQILIPDFEPIIGALIVHYHSLYGIFSDTDALMFKNLYPEFLFRVQEERKD